VTQPTFYPLDTEAHSEGIERQEREAGHLPSSSADVKKRGAIPPLTHMSPLHGAYIVQGIYTNILSLHNSSSAET
jgi:hypothetical protein